MNVSVETIQPSLNSSTKYHKSLGLTELSSDSKSTGYKQLLILLFLHVFLSKISFIMNVIYILKFFK